METSLKLKLELGLETIMLPQDRYKIPIMLSEAYKVKINSRILIAVRDPFADVPGLLLDELTGSYVSTCYFEAMIQKGERI